MLEVYNTLTRKKEIFKSVREGEVTIYVCGPTTYNYFHIGNGRAFLFFDVVRRYLESTGLKVIYVQNITDIDDKIIAQSIEEQLPIDKISRKYIKAFYDDIKALEIKKATHYPRATEYIGQMIDFIDLLVKKGFAYAMEGNVFFSVKAFKNYGKLSGKKIDELFAGARVEEYTKKRNPGDFVLWKKAKKGEPQWLSPWGKGRPGWHTECVVMSRDIFKGTFDIHCGGTDLVFPHHENEIAQAEAVSGKPLANYWMHNGFINIKGEKMSKSLDNFFTVRDVLQKYSAETIRHFYLEKHYRSPIDYNEEALQASKAALKKLYHPFKDIDREELAKMSHQKVLPEYRQEFNRVMDDDFNTAQAIALFFDILKEANNASRRETKLCLLQTLKKLGNTLGFYQHLGVKLAQGSSQGVGNDLIDLLIAYRDRFKAEKNWQYADMIRNDLKKLGINLQDTPEGTKWSLED